MTFSGFLSRYLMKGCLSLDRFYDAAAVLTGCSKDDAPLKSMRELLPFSKQEWSRCKGIGRHAISALDYALELADLNFAMIVPEEDIEENPTSEVNNIDKSSLSAFENLQQQVVSMGCGSAELKMLRPDGFTWVLTVLPPDHPQSL